ncbi:phage tail tape measure protein, partial [Mycobacterium avium]
ASAGESAQNLKAVSDGILQLAGQVGYSAQDLSNNMYMVEKAGYRGADGVNVLKAAAQGAKSENADLKEVLNGLTTSMNDFGYGTDQAA